MQGQPRPWWHKWLAGSDRNERVKVQNLRICAMQGKSHLCIPFLGIARPQFRNFHIHVSMSDLYIPRISPHISCSRIGRPIIGIYKSLTDTWMWKLGLWPHNSFSGNICFEFLVMVLCSVINGLAHLRNRGFAICGLIMKNLRFCDLRADIVRHSKAKQKVPCILML